MCVVHSMQLHSIKYVVLYTNVDFKKKINSLHYGVIHNRYLYYLIISNDKQKS